MTTKGKRSPVSRLVVFDTLEIGPVKIEPDRMVAAYTVRTGGRAQRTELSYKFQESVFEPQDPFWENVASVLAAQVALNYGLFCRRMVFRGRYDAHDRKFLTEMARNTAREIYVKKILQPNPFLKKSAAGLEPVRQTDYLNAEMTFEDSGSLASANSGARTVEIDRSKHAILSSGGKDSLLSYGLLNEVGLQAHPVFVNESGRHWYTALNAYRYFAASVPNTTRVWTNSDRVFAFMLKQLPFVRPDFGSIRSDEYPIRLWTVAVFLFGAIPLLLRRGVGRLVIGDEFDTTLRLTYKGITHYGGLYDQSRFFDNALSRYFGRKKWGLVQFSILRPLSELLIQKTLSERYPELLALQVSCHAAHLDGDRVKPCGRCEKCRRIVGMLMAVGGDPHRCGYDDTQIGLALNALARLGVHQESAGAAHMLHLLIERDLVPPSSPLARAARPCPEVTKLRFDAERSPMDTIPADLRALLYPRLLEHADGATKREGRLWVDFDLMNDPALAAPYRFERRSPGQASDRTARVGASSFLLSDLTWPEVKARLKEVDVALLPVGAIEQHGPHLPLDVDTYDAARLCREVAAACSDPKPLVLPVIPYGVSYHHGDFSGTISVSPDTLSRLVYEIGLSLAGHGVTKLVVVNGHSGNAPALHFAAQMINRDAHIFTCVDTGETSDAEIAAMASTPNDVHAGEIETSTTMAMRPEVVRMELARSNVPQFSSDYLNFSSSHAVGWYARTSRISSDGTLGDPTKADREKGERMWAVMVRQLVRLVEDLKGMALDEIHQRRY